MLSGLAGSEIVIAPTLTSHFGAGAVGKLPGIVGGLGGGAVVVVTDAALAATPVIARVTGVLDAAGIPVTVFSGVHPNPTTGDLAAGADAVSAAASARRAGPDLSQMALVAVGGGSPIDAAKGIALAAVNPQRGRDLGYRGEFARPALPIVAVPTTAGTGAETNAFGVVTDPRSRRKFYVGHASSLPAAAVLDPDLTLGLPPLPTAATGMDALTHAHVLRFNAQARGDRLADVAFALGVGDTARSSGWNADAAIDAVAGLAGRLGMIRRITELGISGTAFDQIAADALDDEVLANTPRQPAAADIHAILHAAR